MSPHPVLRMKHQKGQLKKGAWWREEDEDWSVIETQRISDEMGSTGKCYFCDFSCEPGDSLWYNPPLIDHREEAHPETVEWF